MAALPALSFGSGAIKPAWQQKKSQATTRPQKEKIGNTTLIEAVGISWNFKRLFFLKALQTARILKQLFDDFLLRSGSKNSVT
jgi:hypothetical protein